MYRPSEAGYQLRLLRRRVHEGMGMTMAAALTLVNVGILLANIAVLALGVKLYTEIFKARDQRR